MRTTVTIDDTLYEKALEMDFIEGEKLYGLGCGLVAMALLTATLITSGSRLWALDKRLADLAGRFEVAYSA